MMLMELRWIIGCNLILAVWLGLLANAWKGRNTYVWTLIGLLTSVGGVLALMLMPKLAMVVERSRHSLDARGMRRKRFAEAIRLQNQRA